MELILPSLSIRFWNMTAGICLHLAMLGDNQSNVICIALFIWCAVENA